MPAISGVSHIDLTVTDLEASERWYASLLGAVRVLAGRNDDHHFDSRYLLDPNSLLLIGLVQHDAGEGGFDERRVGLDHLAFNVDTRDELDAWTAHLDDLGVDYDLNEGDAWDVVVLRDPDNVQLEFFLMKADPATFIATAEAVV